MDKENILTKKYLINGPNNIIRLTNGEKILYIFGDIHLPINMQNECLYDKNYDSLDIDKFLFKFIKTEKNKNFDIFGEYYVDDKDYKATNNRNIYLRNFKKIFQFKIKKNNNKIKINSKYPNFRFHFMDIRNNIRNNINFYNIKELFELVFSSLKFLNILNPFELLIEGLNKFYDFINIDHKRNENRYLNKISNIYNNDNIKKKINIILTKTIINLKNIIDEVTILFDFVKKNILNYSRYNFSFENIIKIKMTILRLRDNYTNVLLVMTDLYFLRQFLDRNYVKNGILYTGMQHFNDIAYLLINYFNFEITNILICDPKFEIKNEIKKLNFNNFEYLDILSKYTIGKQLDFNISQCVNLFDFPENFS